MAAVHEQHMRGREFVAGARMSAADIIVACTVDWGGLFGLLEGCPVLHGYLERMYARPHAPRRIAELLQDLRAAPQ